MRPLLDCVFGCMCGHGYETESLYLSLREKERDRGGREFVTSKISEEQSRPLPSEAIHEPINWLCVCAPVCARAHTKGANGPL